jgi:hypothetical protein
MAQHSANATPQAQGETFHLVLALCVGATFATVTTLTYVLEWSTVLIPVAAGIYMGVLAWVTRWSFFAGMAGLAGAAIVVDLTQPAHFIEVALLIGSVPLVGAIYLRDRKRSVPA